MRASAAAIAIGVGACVVSPQCALAQMGGSGTPLGSGGHSAAAKEEPDAPALPPPDSVPGARAREPVAPATRSTGEMSPNEALVDAINRGDIAAARDALNRGAELDAVNILGMTPLDLSVDLGRNDISFLLLSMRGDVAESEQLATAHDREAGAKAGHTAKAASKVATPVRVPVQSKPVATPKLFANDGGTPLPAVGFLGFDSKKSAD
jgi:hypothetical protein